jgi:hypothetical protein
MVYNPPYPDNINNFNVLAGVTALVDPAPTPRVQVHYKNSGIHHITGPVPFVKISESANTSENSDLFSSRVGITLEGKIAYTGNNGVGISGIMNAIALLRGLFYGSGNDNSTGTRNHYNQNFKILCDNATYVEYSGVRVLSFEASPTPDNWTNSANYTVELETYVPRNSGQKYAIKSAVEDWNIEPLEEYAYLGSGSAAGSGQSYTNARSAASYSIDIISLPQYRLSRKLSAVGFVGYNTGIGMNGPHDSYQYAKQWVMDRIKLTHSGVYNNQPFMQFGGLYSNYHLYNHLRTTSFSIEAGSYEVNDTWLAMPTGIGYTEDYTINSSTDMKNIKTVQIQGEIKGLALANWSLMAGTDSRLTFPATGNNLALYSGMNAPLGSGDKSHKKLDSIAVDSPDKIVAHKYVNALSGWLNDIKPYLYKRATVGSYGPDRNVGPYPYGKYDASNTIKITKQPNPMFFKDNLLNIYPISSTENHDPKKGIITYSYEYSNRFKNISGVITEHISINDNSPADVINEAFVLGRRLGPALQNLGSRTSTRRDLTIELTVPPARSIGGFVYSNKECPLWTGGSIYSGVTGLIDYFKPYSYTRAAALGFDNASFETSGLAYVAADKTTWDPIQGRYTCSVSWLYQPCKMKYNQLDS